MIPIATTQVTVLRSDQDGTKDDYDTLTYATVVAGVRAVIGAPQGAESNTGGSSEDVSARLSCDPCDLRHDDRVHDQQTGETWEVTWVRRRVGMGLDHMVGELRSITDRAMA